MRIFATRTGRALSLFLAVVVVGGCTTTRDDTAPPSASRAVRLEFKEQRTTLSDAERAADATYNAAQYAAAQRARRETPSDAFVDRAAKSEYGGRGGYAEHKFRDEVPDDLRALLFEDLTLSAVSDAREVPLVRDGTTEVAGYSLVQLLSRENVRRDVSAPARATVTHLLVSYRGAASAPDSVVRTRAEAEALAADLAKQARTGTPFDALIAKFSDDPSKTENKGTFKDQVIGEPDPAKNAFVKEFNDAIVAGKVGSITGPVETAFGYHVIRIDAKSPRVDGNESQPRVSYAEWFFPTRLAGDWRDTGLTEQMVVAAEGQRIGDAYGVVLTFDGDGSLLFREITKRNIGKPLGIFLDGQMISEPMVQQEITAGEAVITGNFTADQAAALARDIMTAR